MSPATRTDGGAGRGPGVEDDDLVELPLGRDTITWRVNGGPVPYIGASTALLLQVAHPLVAAGVAQHSDYRSDPYSRLYRTLDTVLKLVFGTPEQSQQMTRRLASRHASVKGTSAQGVDYDASQADLGLWVWATLVHTALLAHEYAYGPLSAGERARYYAEARPFAVGSGVPIEAVPDTWDDFLAYYHRAIAEDLEATPECLDVARTVFRPTEPAVLGPLLGRMQSYAAAALMPPRAREIYGLTWDDARERRFRRGMRVLGSTLRLLPAPVRSIGAVLVVDHDLLSRLEAARKKRRARARRRERATA